MPRLYDRIFGRPDPMAKAPTVEPVATRDDDGGVTFLATVPKLDPQSLQIERTSKGRFVVRGVCWVRPRRWQWLSQDVVFDLELPEELDGTLTTTYDDPALTLRFVPTDEHAPSLRAFRSRLADAGWRELRADEGYAFGSWSIELEQRLRVEYNGKDELLELWRETSPDNWRRVWAAERASDQTPTALLDALRGVTQ